MPLASGAPPASPYATLKPAAADARHVYWIEGGDQFFPPLGSIRRVAK